MTGKWCLDRLKYAGLNSGKGKLMRSILGTIAIFAVMSGLIAADDQIDAKKLIGKWELVEGKKGQALMLEFLNEKKMSVTIGEGGKEKIEGTYSILENNRMDVVLKFMGDDIKESLRIRLLMDNELVTEDSKGKTETFRKKK
jgi:uncharacterized protein (TIGR03066 family)